MGPTGRAIFLTACGFAAALLPSVGFPNLWPVLLVVWCLLAAAFLVDVLLTPRVSSVSCEADLPGVLYIGQPSTMTLTLSIPSNRSSRATVHVDLSEDLLPQPQVGTHGTRTGVEVPFPLVSRRRGRVRVETAWVRYRGPLGLWFKTATFPLFREIDVMPNLPMVKTTAIRFFSNREMQTGLKIERYKGDGTEFDSLKEYLVGDDNRTIDWKSSARHHKLLARQFRAERNHQIVLAVDTGHLMSESIEGIPKLDHALNVSLLLAYIGLRGGDRVGLFTFGARIGPYVDPVGGMAAMNTLTGLSAAVEYSEDETNFTLALTTLSQRLRRRSLVILLTDFVDTITTELLLENLDRMSRRHLMVFVALRDPLLERLARSAPATADDVSRAVVSHAFLRDREIVHRRLKRMGIHPIDSEPDRVGPALINHYLDIKRRELI